MSIPAVSKRALVMGAIKSDAHELGNASNYAGSARLALLDHPNARQALHSSITFNPTPWSSFSPIG